MNNRMKNIILIENKLNILVDNINSLTKNNENRKLDLEYLLLYCHKYAQDVCFMKYSLEKSLSNFKDSIFKDFLVEINDFINDSMQLLKNFNK